MQSNFVGKHTIKEHFASACCLHTEMGNEMANLSLSSLASCISQETDVKEIAHESDVYVSESGFSLTQAPEGDFWWFETEDGIFAASKDGAPCPSELLRKTSWLMISHENRIEDLNRSIEIDCIC
ncbi:hypothetical protein SK128_025228 [Halocaridina rubra]|uniref:Uncharacterized protein n=1 Tax=Halocaridina rubra TaxID=373956 RepID=A0AAN8X866_HALRR